MASKKTLRGLPLLASNLEDGFRIPFWSLVGLVKVAVKTGRGMKGV